MLKDKKEEMEDLNSSTDEDIDEKMANLLSHPLVYKDLLSLIIDLRFKTYGMK